MTREPRRAWVALPVAAQRLRVGRASVVAFIRGGRLIGKLVAGRFWWIRADSLTRMVRRQGQRLRRDGRAA